MLKKTINSTHALKFTLLYSPHLDYFKFMTVKVLQQQMKLRFLLFVGPIKTVRRHAMQDQNHGCRCSCSYSCCLIFIPRKCSVIKFCCQELPHQEKSNW